MNNSKTCAVILAAGCGSRMKSPITKQRLEIAGRSVLERTVLAFENCEDVDSVIIVTREDEIPFVREIISTGVTKVVKIVIGGETRAESSFIGFSEIPADTDYVAIHDGARCLITPSMISKVIADAKKHGAATAATYLTDTVKKIDESGFAVDTYDRRYTVTVQTPQIFRADIYKRAVEGDAYKASDITDDNMLVERLGEKIYCTDVGRDNIKITVPSDIEYAEYILKRGEFRE